MSKKFDRFNGVTEEELYGRTLDDLIDFNLDIVFVNINPGLYSVYKGHHYAGPGNHFWRCLYESGLTSRILKASEDYKILDYRMGLVNMNEKPNIKSCQELNDEEIRQSSENLINKIKHYKPKIVAFNGKTIYEMYLRSSVDKDFNFGKQANRLAFTSSYMFVMPSSSARCSQLPRVIDKSPFYIALKHFRDFLNGRLAHLNDEDIMFPDFKVALEVDNGSTPNGNKVDYGSMDSGDEDDQDEGDDGDDDAKHTNNQTGTNGHKIKFVRLNNLPYSKIPPDLLNNLRIQKQSKKNVTLTTTKDYFNNSSLNGHANNAKQIMNEKGNKYLNGIGGASASCGSDIETASTATNDSTDPFNDTNADSFANGYLTQTSNVKLSNQSSGMSVASPASSKVSSIILNMCNSNNSNSKLGTQSPQVKPTGTPLALNRACSPKPLSALSTTAPSAQVNIVPNAMNSRQSVLINNNHCVMTPQGMSPHLSQASQSYVYVNNSPNPNQIKNGQFTHSNIQVHQSINQQQPQQQQEQPIVVLSSQAQQANNQIIIIDSNSVAMNQANALFDDEFTNEPHIDLEIVNDTYKGDYYRLEPTSQVDPTINYSSEEYSALLNIQLSQSIKLFYDKNHSTYQQHSYQRKRLFSNMNDAVRFYNSTNDRQTVCRVKMSQL